MVSADVPESFNVLIHELQGLGLDISMIGDSSLDIEDEEPEAPSDDDLDLDFDSLGGDVLDIGAELPPPGPGVRCRC